jgi:CubicO group peptidase (beta-lactamase class C family)
MDPSDRTVELLAADLLKKFPRTAEVLARGIEEGLHPGAQIYVSQDGKTLVDAALGEARPGVSMTPTSITWWLSSVKPIIAVAVAQIWERGLLALDDRVAVHIPEFARGGKDAITIRHLLTHTGGFRIAGGDATGEPWDILVEKICAARIEPGWKPGEMAGYHASSSWTILAELVRRTDGRMIDQYVREQIFQPLAMSDASLGLSESQQVAFGDRIALMFEDGSPMSQSPSELARVNPGGSGRGPIRTLARFYEMLLCDGTLDGARIVSPQTVAAITARHRVGMMDRTFRHVMDWGLGFIINSSHYGDAEVPYGYGHGASARTFGHSGAQSSCSFCDPEHALVVAWLCNGRPGETQHQARQRMINDAIYKDLGIE